MSSNEYHPDVKEEEAVITPADDDAEYGAEADHGESCMCVMFLPLPVNLLLLCW